MNLIDHYPTLSVNSLPDMTLLQETSSKPPLFSLGCLPKPLQAWCETTAKAASSPPDYVLAGLLAACAGVIGNKAKANLGRGWIEPCILWMAVVGKPSQGKTPALSGIIRTVKKYESGLNSFYDGEMLTYKVALEEFKVRKSKWEAECKKSKGTFIPMPPEIKEPTKPTRKRLVLQDSTIEQACRILGENPNGLLQYRDELAGWLGGMIRYKNANASDEPFWTESWSNGSYSVDRKHLDDTLPIEDVSISVLGGIQPDRLKPIIKGDDTGFSARFLFAWPDPVPLEISTEDPDFDKLKQLVHRLYAMPTVELIIPSQAGSVYQMRRYCKEQSERYTGMMSSLYGKATGMGVRLAMALALIDWGMGNDAAPPEVLAQKYVEYGMALMKDYFLPMAHRVTESAMGSACEGYGRTLARWIMWKKPETLNQRDIYKVHRIPSLNSAKKAELAIKELEEANWLVPNPDTTNNRKDYFVNVQLWQADTAV